MNEVREIDRNALLIYLRDVRDLEFAKNRMKRNYDTVSENIQSNISELRQTNYRQIPMEKSGWEGKITVFVFGIIMVIINFGLMMLTVEKNWMIISIFFAFVMAIILAITIVIASNAVNETANNKKAITNAMIANRAEAQREENNK